MLAIILLVIFWGIACTKEAGGESGNKHDAIKEHKHENSSSEDKCEADEHKHENSSSEDKCEADEHKHDHSSHGSHDKPKSLEEREKIKCEHGILQMECKDCRWELGFVELDKKIEKAFIKTERISKSVPVRTLGLVGEVSLNQLKTVMVTPIVAGRVNKVVKKLGDTVKPGEILVVLQSYEYGKAKLDYISAYQRYSLAQKNYEWFQTTHTNLQQLVDTVKKGEKGLDFTKVIVGIKIGKYKEKLVETTTQYRMVQAKHERETQVIKNVRRLLQLLQQGNNLEEMDKELATLRIGEWKGKVSGAVSKLQVARKNYEREQTLNKTGATTQKELQEAESNYRSAQGECQGLVEELSLWSEQKENDLQAELEASLARYLSTVEEAELDLDVHRMEVEKELQEAISQKATMKKMLELLGISEQDIQKLSKQTPEDIKDLGELELRSPIGGIVFSCDLSEGQFVEASRELYVVSDLTTLWVWCDLYESHLATLKPFLKKLSTIQAELKLPDHYTSNIPVAIDYISEKVDEKTRTVKMRGIIQNSKGELKPGMFIKLQLKISGKKTAMTVPEDAIFKEEGQSFLFKGWKDRFWVRNEIDLGMKIGNRQEVLAGIAEGDIIVSEGGFLLKSEIMKSKMGSG